MLSRVAENLFWMGRYLERADDVRRMLSVNHYLTIGSSANVEGQWTPMLETNGDSELFFEMYKESTRENIIDFLCLNKGNPNSIYSCIAWGRENARAVREQLPIEVWESINAAFLFMQSVNEETFKADPIPTFSELRLIQERYQGTLHSCLSKVDAWHFMNLGIYLERADKTSRILDVKYFVLLPSVNDVGGSIDTLGWEAVLRSVSGLTMYRQQQKTITAAFVVQFLLFDMYFPRSVLHCLMEAELILKRLSGQSVVESERFPNVAVQKLGKVLSYLRYVDIDEVFRIGLHEFLNELQIMLNEVGEAIHAAFFNQEYLQEQI